MKKPIFLAAAMFASLGAAAAGTCNLQGTTFAVDTLQHYYIGPGVTHTHLQLNAAGRYIQVYAVSTDFTAGRDLTEMRVVLGQDSCRNGEAITAMARRKTNDSRQIIAGVNGDFFITSAFAAQHEFGNQILGYPNMSCVIDGKIAAPDMIDITSRENALIIGSDGWWIDATDLRYRLLNNDGSVKVDAAAINYPRRAGEMVVYNSYAGKYTKTDASGRELVLRLADGAKWHMNASVKFIVDSDWRQGGNSRIPDDGLVISCGPNYANEWIDGLKTGDIVKLKIVCSLPAFDGIKPDIQQVIGGDVRILKEGKVTTEAIRWINTPSARYSRSLVGYSADRSLMVMAAVDAGTANTTGMSYYEAADMMAYLGCYDALDFDGGGSTVLWTQAKGIVNVPRDGSERAVGNGLFVAMNTPKDTEVVDIRFADHTKVMPRYGTYSPVIYGYNKYGQLVDTDVRDFVLEAPAELGTASSDGTLFASGTGCHALTAVRGDSRATIAVTIDSSFPTEPRYASLVIDGKRHPSIELQAKVLGEMMPVASYAFDWTSDDPAVVEVSPEGVLSAISNGATTVTGVCGDAKVQVAVTVQKARAEIEALDPQFDPQNWKVGLSSIKPATVTALDNGCSVEFKVTSTRGTKFTLSRDIDIWGCPDGLQVRIRPANDVKINALTLNIRPANAARTVAVRYEGTIVPGEENLIKFPLSDFADPDDAGIFPLHFVSLAVEPGMSTGTYTVDIPGIEVLYSGVDNSGVESVSQTIAAATLPVRVQGSQVCLGIDADTIEAYSPDGRLVATSTGSAITLPGRGLYIIRARLAGRVYSAKARI